MSATCRPFALALALVGAVACSRTAGTTKSPPPDHVPLVAHHTELHFADLPPPFASRDATNPPEVVAAGAGDRLSLPPGFAASTYAEGGFEEPRFMALAPEGGGGGDVFVSDSDGASVDVLRGTDAHGAAAQRFTFATGLLKPFGIVFLGGYVYIGDTNGVVRFAYRPGQTQAAGDPETVAPLPGRGYHEHWTRNLIVSPDQKKLFVTIGSSSNVDVEIDPERASILEMNPDGSGRRIYANGLRNPVGAAFYPGTSQLWAVVEERDRLGDDLVPDYLVAVKDGGFYGWPFAYLGPHPDPRRNGERLDLAQKTLEPDVLFAAHSAVLGLVFYEGSMFPAEYKGDAIVAMHGSWNRRERTGYKLVRVHFQNGRPTGGYDDFVTGWMRDPRAREVWGRPVGLLVLGDGSLLVSDDGAKKIWRITWSGA
jgi:glucose/arabinose dehydrogenase